MVLPCFTDSESRLSTRSVQPRAVIKHDLVLSALLRITGDTLAGYHAGDLHRPEFLKRLRSVRRHWMGAGCCAETRRWRCLPARRWGKLGNGTAPRNYIASLPAFRTARAAVLGVHLPSSQVAFQSENHPIRTRLAKLPVPEKRQRVARLAAPQARTMGSHQV